MLEIPANRGHNVGAFDHPKTKAEAAAFAEKVEAASMQAYGTVGPEFVRHIIEEGVEKVAERVKAAVADFIKKNTKPGHNEQVHRAVKSFALAGVAGEMAIDWGIAPRDKDEALAAAQWALKQWIDARGGTGSTEESRQVSQIRALICSRRFDGFASPDFGGIPKSMRAAGYIPTSSVRP